MRFTRDVKGILTRARARSRRKKKEGGGGGGGGGGGSWEDLDDGEVATKGYST